MFGQRQNTVKKFITGNACNYLCDLLTEITLLTGLQDGTTKSQENSAVLAQPRLLDT